MTKRINRLGVRAASTLAAMVLAANAAWALEPFRVQDIRIEGLQRVEPGTVFASIPLRVGDQYDDDKGAAAIRSLFALGLFKDIRLEANGNVLVVVVEERPTIAEVNFAGTKEFDKETLQKAMRDVGLAEGRPFDKALADEFAYRCKQAGQLASKMRHLTSPWVGLLESGDWLGNARHANAQAARLEAGLCGVPGVEVLGRRDCNAVFVRFPGDVAARLRELGWRFYDFIGSGGCRLMCSWATTDADVDAILSDTRRLIASTDAVMAAEPQAVATRR
jgi:hypothetical protein